MIVAWFPHSQIRTRTRWRDSRSSATGIPRTSARSTGHARCGQDVSCGLSGTTKRAAEELALQAVAAPVHDKVKPRHFRRFAKGCPSQNTARDIDEPISSMWKLKIAM